MTHNKAQKVDQALIRSSLISQYITMENIWKYNEKLYKEKL